MVISKFPHRNQYYRKSKKINIFMSKAKSNNKFTSVLRNNSSVNHLKLSNSKKNQKKTISKCKSDDKYSKTNKGQNTQLIQENENRINISSLMDKKKQTKRVQRVSSKLCLGKEDKQQKSIQSSPSKANNPSKKTYILNNVKKTKKPLLLNHSLGKNSGFTLLASFQKNSSKTIKNSNSTFWNNTTTLDKTISKASNLTKKKRSATIKSFNIQPDQSSSKFSKHFTNQIKESKQNHITQIKTINAFNESQRNIYYNRWVQQKISSVHNRVEELKTQINKSGRQKLELIRNDYNSIIKQLRQNSFKKQSRKFNQHSQLPKCQISRIETIMTDGHKRKGLNQIHQSEESSFQTPKHFQLNFNKQNANQHIKNFPKKSLKERDQSCSNSQHWDSYLSIPCSQPKKNKTKGIGLNLNLQSLKKSNPSIKQYHQQFMDNQEFFSQSWKREILKEKCKNV